MINKELVKYLEEAAPDSAVLFITDEAIFEVLTVAFVAGNTETQTEFHVGLNKIDEIIPVGEDNTYE